MGLGCLVGAGIVAYIGFNSIRESIVSTKEQLENSLTRKKQELKQQVTEYRKKYNDYCEKLHNILEALIERNKRYNILLSQNPDLNYLYQSAIDKNERCIQNLKKMLILK